MSAILSIKKYIDGSSVESEALYKQHLQSLYSYGIGLGFPNDICMDAIHDVFYKVCNLKTEEILKIDNVKSYLLRSLRNRLLDLDKKNKRITSMTDLEHIPFNIEVSTDEMNLIEAEDKEKIARKVEMLLNSLTNRQREAVYLRYMLELSYEEIGTLLNMTPKSARMLVHRAMDKMRDFSDIEKKVLFFILSNLFLNN